MCLFITKMKKVIFLRRFGFNEIQVEYRYHRDENISDTNLLLVRYHRNENISGANLLLVPFRF